jgi:hypothetical protein
MEKPEGEVVPQTDACLICGKPWTAETDATVFVGSNGGEIWHTWLGHLECIRKVAHPGFHDLLTP